MEENKVIFSITKDDVEMILERELGDAELEIWLHKFTIENWTEYVAFFAEAIKE